MSNVELERDGARTPRMPENGPRAGDDARIQARRVESIMRIPVVLQVVVGSATLPVASLLKLGRGAVLPLDHRVGDPVDVVVNGRTIARGEVVVVEEDGARFGVSLTEICEPQQEQMS
ncbi:flagellar motor switch protein FliN [Methylocystis parvus]|uniref:Flagellar motor switch protein FliN n=2 Tax=Methylocystis parvus TaxID=134 RepID=A0A6B8M8F3_9HYPH|nr:flagellar motor switch protein FliN [Methylocystis parvus]